VFFAVQPGNVLGLFPAASFDLRPQRFAGFAPTWLDRYSNPVTWPIYRVSWGEYFHN
jgi:hypothetical protein